MSARSPHPLRRAAIETLEDRRLLAYSGGAFDLPLQYDFATPANGVEDRDGENVGFPIVQGNAAGNELNSSLIDLDRQSGVLRITSSGNAANGSNFGGDNSLVNGLQLPFDASEDWLVHTRVTGAENGLADFAEGFEQAGLLVGPSQDRYVKLVFGHDGTQNIVQFVAETSDAGGTISYPLGESGEVDAVDPANAAYVDLWLAGNAETGEITAQYRVEGGRMVRMDSAFDAPAIYFTPTNARAGVLAVHKNGGDPITAEFDLFEVTNEGLPSTQPFVRDARPADGDGDVFRDAFVALDLELPNASIDDETLIPANVRLIRVSDGRPVETEINTSGGGDAIVVTPVRALDADTEYRLEISEGVEDILGVPFAPFTSTFRTNFSLSGEGGSLGEVAFEQVAQSATSGTLWSSLTVGPDDRLYAVKIDGGITRFDIAGDGTLSNGFDIDTITDAEGGPRVATGLAFAPDATADDLVAYVTHTQFNDVTTDRPEDLGDDLTGKLSRLSGDDLGSIQDLVTGLPRSIRDHLTNQPVFGPDGRVYLGQGANNAMGAPDAAWGFREEIPLSGSVLAIDVDQIEADDVVVDTRPSAGYDPDAAGAPVVVFGEGVRNAYNVVWHSNGQLYAPTNGSAAGGNTPAAPDGSAIGLSNVPQTQNDYLFRVEQGQYYGHPNPTRGNYVLGGGNPTSGNDVAQVDAYPVGTLAEPNYGGFAYDFGKNQSPNGALEFQSNGELFGGALDGKLIVTRYSGGDDLIVLDVEDDGSVTGGTTGIPGFDGFSDPLDVEQLANGTMYVSEFGSQEITLLRPVETGGAAGVAARRIFVDVAAGESGVRPFVVRNTGDEPLIVNPYTLGITGPDKDLFEFVDAPTRAVAVPAGGAATFDVQFNAPDDAAVGDRYDALVFVRTSDSNAPEVGSSISGIVKRGEDGANEPSLQDVFDAYALDITTGDPDPATTEINVGELGGLDAQRFAPADPTKPIAFEVIASYSPENTPALSFGFYEPGRPQVRTKLGEVFTNQGLDPVTVAPDKFFDGGDGFGLYLQSPAFGDDIGPGLSADRGRLVYSEAVLNTWEDQPGERDKVAVYDIPGIEDALAVSFEEFELASDYNDLVLVMRNVVAVGQSGPRVALETAADNGLERLIFNEIAPAGRDNSVGPQTVRNSRDVTFYNAGGAPMTISGVTAPAGFAASVSDTTIAPGDSAVLTIDFVATSEGSRGGVYQGEVVFNYDGGRSTAVPVGGYFQPYSENAGGTRPIEEPTLNEMMEVFGLGIDVGTDAQRVTGTPDAIGDEVLSPFWRAAQQDLPVEVYQLAAFHNSTADPIFWFERDGAVDEASAAARSSEIFRHENTSFQSFLPEINGGVAPAAGSFSPGDAEFGFRVVGEYSVDDFNDDNSPGVADDQHLFRFFPLKDEAGNTVEDAWLVTMDFTGFNFDYNDNVYVVRNIQPADLAAPPLGATATPPVDGRSIVYFAPGQDASGVSLFRSDDGGASFARVATFADRNFLALEDVEEDTIVRIAGVDSNGNPGTFSDVAIG